MSRLLFQTYQRARDRLRAGDVLSNAEKRPGRLARVSGKGQV